MKIKDIAILYSYFIVIGLSKEIYIFLLLFFRLVYKKPLYLLEYKSFKY